MHHEISESKISDDNSNCRQSHCHSKMRLPKKIKEVKGSAKGSAEKPCMTQSQIATAAIFLRKCKIARKFRGRNTFVLLGIRRFKLQLPAMDIRTLKSQCFCLYAFLRPLPLDTCLDNPFLCHLLSSRFAPHGLRALELPSVISLLTL